MPLSIAPATATLLQRRYTTPAASATPRANPRPDASLRDDRSRRAALLLFSLICGQCLGHNPSTQHVQTTSGDRPSKRCVQWLSFDGTDTPSAWHQHPLLPPARECAAPSGWRELRLTAVPCWLVRRWRQHVRTLGVGSTWRALMQHACAGASSPTASPPETKAASPPAPSPISHVTLTAALKKTQDSEPPKAPSKGTKKAPAKAAKAGATPAAAAAGKGSGRLGGAAEASQARRVKAIQAAAKLQVCLPGPPPLPTGARHTPLARCRKTEC